MTFDLEIIDCKVDHFYSPAQPFEDLLLKLGDSVRLSFKNFVQDPSCKFFTNYTVTAI